MSTKGKDGSIGLPNAQSLASFREARMPFSASLLFRFIFRLHARMGGVGWAELIDGVTGACKSHEYISGYRRYSSVFEIINQELELSYYTLATRVAVSCT